MGAFALRGSGAIADEITAALTETGRQRSDSAGELLVVVADATDPAPVDALDDGRWAAIFDARLRPVVAACVEGYDGMVARGGGAIVLVSVEAPPGAGAHVAAADGALDGFTKSLAAEAAPHGVRVNLIRTAGDAARATAATVVFLAGDGTNMVGQVLRPAAAAAAPPPASGRLALVTGSTQGIGHATARRLMAGGDRVAVNGPDAEVARRVAAELGAIAAPADISVAGEVEAMARGLEAAEGPIGLLVANAAYMSMGPLTEHDAADWWKNTDVNLTGNFRVIRAALGGMRRRGGGHIVIIASEFGVIGWPNATGYAASKSGVAALAAALADELAPDGIVVSAIAPGVTDTAQLEVDAADAGVSLAEIHAHYAKDIPLRRIGRPEEIASTVAFLASPAAAAYAGQILQPNGGATRARP